MFRKLSLVVLLIVFLACGKQEEVVVFDKYEKKEYLSEREMVVKIKEVKSYLNANKVKVSLKDLDDDSIKRIYKSNLETIHKITGLNIELEEKDVALLLDVKEGKTKLHAMALYTNGAKNIEGLEDRQKAMAMLLDAYGEDEPMITDGNDVSFGCTVPLP